MFRKENPVSAEVKSTTHEAVEVKKLTSGHPILTETILDQLQKQLAAKTNLIQSRHYQELYRKYVDDIDFNSIEDKDIKQCLQELRQGIRIVDYDKDFSKRLPSHISKEEIIKKFQEKLKVEGKEQPYSYVELIDFNDLSIHLEKWPFLYDILTQKIAAQGDAYITNLKQDFLCVICTENTKPGHWIKRANEINSQMAYLPIKIDFSSRASCHTVKDIFEAHLHELKASLAPGELIYHRCDEHPMKKIRPYVITFCEKPPLSPKKFKELIQQSLDEAENKPSENKGKGWDVPKNEVVEKFKAIKKIFHSYERAKLECCLAYNLKNVLDVIKSGHREIWNLKDISFRDLEVIFVQCDYDFSETENKIINEHAASIKNILREKPEQVSIAIIDALIEKAIRFYESLRDYTVDRDWKLSKGASEIKNQIKTIFLKLHAAEIDIAPSLFDDSKLLSARIQAMKSKLKESESLIEKEVGDILGQLALQIKPEIERPSGELKR